MTEKRDMLCACPSQVFFKAVSFLHRLVSKLAIAIVTFLERSKRTWQKLDHFFVLKNNSLSHLLPPSSILLLLLLMQSTTARAWKWLFPQRIMFNLNVGSKGQSQPIIIMLLAQTRYILTHLPKARIITLKYT